MPQLALKRTDDRRIEKRKFMREPRSCLPDTGKRRPVQSASDLEEVVPRAEHDSIVAAEITERAPRSPLVELSRSPELEALEAAPGDPRRDREAQLHRLERRPQRELESIIEQ